MPHGNMEGVGVILPVRNTLDPAVTLLIHPNKPAGQALGRGTQQGKVHLHSLRLPIAEITHKSNDFQTLLLHLLAGAVVLAVQGGQSLSKTNKTDGHGTVLQHFLQVIPQIQLVRIQPHTLAHQERIVEDVLVGLNLEAVQQLLGNQLQHMLQFFVEGLLIALCFDCQTGQIDGGEAQVASGIGDLAAGIVDITHNSGTAAHGCYLRLRTTGDIVLQVERRVQEGIVGEQTPGADLAAQAEQVVVGVRLIVVDAFLDLKNVYGKNTGLAVAQTGIQCQKHIADGHSALRRGVGAVIDGGEGGLGTGTGVHGIQIVDKALHGLLGVTIGLALGTAACLCDHLHGLIHRNLIALSQLLRDPCIESLRILQPGRFTEFTLHTGDHSIDAFVHIAQIQCVLQCLSQLPAIGLAVGLCNALGHTIVKVGDGLTAVLVILIGLNGNGSQCCIALDALGLPEIAMTSGETAVKQLENIDLAAGCSQAVEIKVMDVDIAFPICLGMLGAEQIHLIVGLGTGGSDLQHGAHGGVTVNVGIVPLHITLSGISMGNFLDGLHQAGVGLSSAGTCSPVQNIGLGRSGEAVVHQLPLHRILNQLNIGRFSGKTALQLPLNIICHSCSISSIALMGSFQSPQNGRSDFILVIQHNTAVSFGNAGNHIVHPDFLVNSITISSVANSFLPQYIAIYRAFCQVERTVNAILCHIGNKRKNLQKQVIYVLYFTNIIDAGNTSRYRPDLSAFTSPREVNNSIAPSSRRGQQSTGLLH